MQRKKLLALPIDTARTDIPAMQAIEEEGNNSGTYKRRIYNKNGQKARIHANSGFFMP